MAKTAARRKAKRPKPDALAIAAASERSKLRRLVQAKRDIANLVVRLRRANDRAHGTMVALANDIAKDHGYKLVFDGEVQRAPGGDGDAQQPR